jgi:glycosyltransferase involved in cell wall biosynthesis
MTLKSHGLVDSRPRDRARVLYIHHAADISGATLSLLFLLRRLDRRRYEPIVACLYEGPAAQAFRDEGIETLVEGRIDHFDHTAGAWFSLRRPDVLLRKTLHFPRSVRTTERLVRELQPDLVHLNSTVLPASALGARRAGVPVIWHIREPLHPGYLGLRRALMRRMIHRWADRVIAICRSNAAPLIADEHVRVVPNFVDLAEFRPEIDGDPTRRQLGLDPSAPVILMLGGVSIIKGTLPLVQAMSSICESLPDAQLLIAGPVPTLLSGLRGSLSQLQSYYRRILIFISEHDLADHVHLLGVRRDVPQLIAAANLVAFPSVVPHFARPILEAGAMSKPVVASDLEGPNEMTQQGENGLLVPPNDSTALAEALVTVLEHPNLADEMGRIGREQACERYDAEQNVRETLAIYEELLA